MLFLFFNCQWWWTQTTLGLFQYWFSGLGRRFGSISFGMDATGLGRVEAEWDWGRRREGKGEARNQHQSSPLIPNLRLRPSPWVYTSKSVLEKAHWCLAIMFWYSFGGILMRKLKNTGTVIIYVFFLCVWPLTWITFSVFKPIPLVNLFYNYHPFLKSFFLSFSKSLRMLFRSIFYPSKNAFTCPIR